MDTYGITFWAKVASSTTRNASETKDWRLTTKHDKRMKEIATRLSSGKGYIIATERELQGMYPDVFTAGGYDPRRLIWAVEYWPYGCGGNKMGFCPIR